MANSHQGNCGSSIYDDNDDDDSYSSDYDNSSSGSGSSYDTEDSTTTLRTVAHQGKETPSLSANHTTAAISSSSSLLSPVYSHINNNNNSGNQTRCNHYDEINDNDEEVDPIIEPCQNKKNSNSSITSSILSSIAVATVMVRQRRGHPVFVAQPQQHHHVHDTESSFQTRTATEIGRAHV